MDGVGDRGGVDALLERRAQHANHRGVRVSLLAAIAPIALALEDPRAHQAWAQHGDTDARRGELVSQHGGDAHDGVLRGRVRPE